MGLGRPGSCLVPGMMRLPPGPWSGWHWEKGLLQGPKTVGLLQVGLPLETWLGVSLAGSLGRKGFQTKDFRLRLCVARVRSLEPSGSTAETDVSGPITQGISARGSSVSLELVAGPNPNRSKAESIGE